MKNLLLLAFVFILILGVFSCEKGGGEKEENESITNGLKQGDVLFQTCQYSSQSEAIALATDCKYTHVGILVKNENKWYVYEAVGPVKLTPLKQWIKNGENQLFEVKRYKSKKHNFTVSESKKLIQAGLQYKELPYDIYFRWNDQAIYCSELVWKIYFYGLNIKLSEPKKLRSYTLNHPVVAKKLLERYGKNIPLDEKMVAPSDLFHSNKLVSINDFSLPE